MSKAKLEVLSATSTTNTQSASTKKEAPAVPPVDPADLAVGGELADARDFNTLWNSLLRDPHDTVAGLPTLPNVGEILRGNYVLDFLGDADPDREGDNNVVDQIDYGTNLAGSEDGTITWGFWDFRTKVGPNANGESRGYFPFTDAQRAAAVISIRNWDELITTNFELVDVSEHDVRDWAHGDAPDILMANTLTGPAQAWAYLPTEGGKGGWHRAAGDVWIGAAADNRTDLFDGGYGLTTQVHELGHSLGLNHPGDYDFGDDTDGDGVPDPITYDGDAFYWQDSRTYSIMSYFDTYDTGNNMVDYNILRVVYQATPMVHDMWVIQYKYGVDETTRTGDSVYGFESSADVTNTAMQFVDGERMVMFSIWDAGGNDTLNLSGYYTPSIIDLREGAYTSAGGLGAYDPAWVGVTPDADEATYDAYLDFVNANNEALGLPNRNASHDLYFGGREGANEGVPWSDFNGRDWLMENNIGIAYGAIIENAIGGHGNDRINGNQAHNQFTGGDGDDVFVIADFSGTISRPDGDELVDDESVDTIMDFVSGEDTIDLSELGVEYADLSVAGNTWTVERGDDDLSFVVLGDAAVESDFFFG